jgi:hypothetical protein
MRRVIISLTALFVLGLWPALPASGQAPAAVTGTPSSGDVKLTGEIVDVICYSGKGIAAGTGPTHVDCAKECAKKDGALFGVLTDGDGMFKIIGDFAANHHAKLVEYIGKQVEVTGKRTRYLDYSTAIIASKITVLPKKAS